MDYNYILYAFAFPLLAAFISKVVRSPNLRDGINIIITLLSFNNMISLYGVFKEKGAVSLEFFEILPNLKISFSIEPLGMIFALIVSFLWIVSIIYSIGYMRANNEPRQGTFFTFYNFSIFAALGIAFSDNLFTMFIFYEILTIGTYPLVTHSRTDEAKKSGRVYLGILMGTSVLLLFPAILLTINIAGTADFIQGGILQGKASPVMTSILLFMFMYGIGKAALMPIHKWLPAAMVAPTPVSALLHAVAVVKAGVFCVVKIIVYIFGTFNMHTLTMENPLYGGWLMYISGFTIIVASVIALNQDNLKKRLAYSTISQLSYVIMAASMFTPVAILAASFHIVAHAFGKITLFFAAGSIYTSSHKKNVSQLSGIGRKMPITMVAFTIASISMIGLPPAVGFISKWYMLTGAMQDEVYFVLAVIIASTILNAAYFLPIIYKAFFEDAPKCENEDFGEAPFPIVLSITVTAAATLILFFMPSVFMDLAVTLTVE